MRRAQWLAHQPFTLSLSAGFFGFFAHAGLLQALEQFELWPARIVGTSAGALAGGLWAAGLSGRDLEEAFNSLSRSDFWDPGLPLGGLLRGRKFASLLDELLIPSGTETIEATRVPFVAVAHDVLARKTVSLERGRLEPAIRASCAVPLMFRPVRVDGRLLIDGGYSDRGGFVALADGERTLYHHLSHNSPWSGIAGPEEHEIARVDERLTLIMPGLPRVTPFRLQRGRHAVDIARLAAARWLEGDVED